MARDLSLNRSKLTALLLESFTYGLFFVLFCVLIAISYFSKNKDIPKKRYIVSVAALMMLLATSHLVIDFLRALEAFVPNNPQRTPDQFFKKLSHPYAILNWALYALQTILGDSVLIWRCYVLCDKKWWVLVPGAPLIAFNIAALGVIIHYLTFATGAVFIHLTLPWMSAWISATTAIQLIYSIAIVVQVLRRFASAGQHVNSVVTVIVESCALYTLFALALLITFERASDADWVLIDMITSLVGISFCLIIIRLHFHFGKEEVSTFPSRWSVHRSIARQHETVSGTMAGSVPDVGSDMGKDLKESPSMMFARCLPPEAV